MFDVLRQLIVNGANGQRGLHAPKLAIQGSKPGKEKLLNKKSLVVILVLENLPKASTVMPIHVQSIVNGVNGVLGVNVPKAVMEELNVDFALNSKMINLEGLSVQDKQMRPVVSYWQGCDVSSRFRVRAAKRPRFRPAGERKGREAAL